MLAGAVQHGHDQGLSHGHLRPATILVDAAGRPFLVDFGTAWRLGGPAPALAGRAIAEAAACTSPELARGTARTVEAHADVYGLGALLREALTGKPPVPAIPADEAEADRGSPGSTPGAHETDDWRLGRIGRRALSTDPADRQPTAAALAADLRSYLARRRGRFAGLRGWTWPR